jgi:hypothetical protein
MEFLRFITMLTITHHLILSWANTIHSIIPHSVSFQSILILSSHLFQGLLSGPFLSGFQRELLYIFLSTPMHITNLTYLISPFGHDNIWSRVQLTKLPILKFSVTSSLLAQNILLSTLPSNTISVIPFRGQNTF